MNGPDVRDLLARALPDAAATRVTRESALAAGRRAAHRRRVRTQASVITVFGLVLVGTAVVPWYTLGGGSGTAATSVSESE